MVKKKRRGRAKKDRGVRVEKVERKKNREGGKGQRKESGREEKGTARWKKKSSQYGNFESGCYL